MSEILDYLALVVHPDDLHRNQNRPSVQQASPYTYIEWTVGGVHEKLVGLADAFVVDIVDSVIPVGSL